MAKIKKYKKTITVKKRKQHVFLKKKNPLEFDFKKIYKSKEQLDREKAILATEILEKIKLLSNLVNPKDPTITVEHLEKLNKLIDILILRELTPLFSSTHQIKWLEKIREKFYEKSENDDIDLGSF